MTGAICSASGALWVGWLARSGRWHKWGKDWSILAGKTLIQTRKPDGSFRDNARISVIIYRVSVIIYEKSGKNRMK